MFSIQNPVSSADMPFPEAMLATWMEENTLPVMDNFTLTTPGGTPDYKAERVVVFGALNPVGVWIVKMLIEARRKRILRLKALAIFIYPEEASNMRYVLELSSEHDIDIVTGDITKPLELRRAFQTGRFGFDTVISAVGPDLLLNQIQMIKIAEETPCVQRFFPSEYAQDIKTFPHGVSNTPPHTHKMMVREYFKRHVERLQHTFLVTGAVPEMFISPQARPDLGSFNPILRVTEMIGDKERQISFTTLPEYAMRYRRPFFTNA